jgi:hypothetical protein
MGELEIMQAVERLIRKRTGVAKGTMPISEATVNHIVSSAAARTLIGKPRAVKVWGAVASLVLQHGHRLVDAIRRAHRWATDEELRLMQTKAEAARSAEGNAHAQTVAAEVTGSVAAWIQENEEKLAGTSIMKLRPGKLTQLKNARKNLAKKRGGQQAITAALVRLMATEQVLVTSTPNKPHNLGKDTDWISTATAWMVDQGWETAQEAQTTAQAATSFLEKHSTLTEDKSILLLTLGVGWGSVREGLEALRSNVRVVGADRRGTTYTGWKKGNITAELEQDWNNTTMDLLTALSKKASVSVHQWDLVTLEPECTVFSQGNSMNQAKGTAHGKRAMTEQNRTAASKERLEEEIAMYQQAKDAVRTQLLSLERNPHLLFCLENPATSELWDLPDVQQIIARNQQWKLTRIDRCAYGRKAQKPTNILHNTQWIPVGTTGNGNCLAGACTGWKTESGKTKHPEQSLPDTKDRAVSRGTKRKGRYEYSRDAAINAIEVPLLEEILNAIGL